MLQLLLGTGLLATLVLSVAGLWYCLHRDDNRGATPLAIVFAGIGCWVFADFVHVVLVETNGDPMAAGMLPVRLLGIELTAVGMLLLGLGYTGRVKLITPRALGLLSIKPALIIGFSLSPARDAIFPARAASVPLGYEFVPTPLFVAHVSYSYGLVTLGLGLVAATMLRSPAGYRRQLFALLVAILVPFATSLSFQTGLLAFDLTAVSFLVTGLVLLYATFRLRLLDAIPVARQRVLDEMQDMVIVFDEDDRILHLNQSAADAFGGERELIGAPGTELFPAEAFEGFGSGPGSTEHWLTVDGEQRLVSVRSSEYTDVHGQQLAHVLVCRDITERREQERNLRQRERELQALKNIQSHFLQEDLRESLDSIRIDAWAITDEDDPADLARFETLIEKTDRIVELSEKARVIEQLVETDDWAAYDVAEGLEEIVAEKRNEFGSVSFEVHVDEHALVRTVPQVDRALANAIDNAARYNTATDPAVGVETASRSDRVTVRIRDNGPGIDEGEANAVLRGEETALEHGSGFGLWLVYWVVEKSDGRMEIETAEEGTVLELTFDRLDPPDAGGDPATTTEQESGGKSRVSTSVHGS